MFITRWKNNYVLGNEKGYYNIDFPFSQFDWNSTPNSPFIENSSFIDEIDQIPVYEKAKIICVGRNYADHAKELGHEIPSEPLLFWKPHSSLLAPHGKILLPEQSNDVQYETELVAVIGKGGKHISQSQALNHVFGFTIGLDITARDLQRSDKTWFRGKGFDTFAPIGPIIVPPHQLNLEDCSVKLQINGQLKQQGNTRDFIFKLHTIISYVSQIITLEPGDLIFTGTPEGVGKVVSGDILQASISNIGTLEVSVA